jgi:hypothetical protein
MMKIKKYNNGNPSTEETWLNAKINGTLNNKINPKLKKISFC